MATSLTHKYIPRIEQTQENLFMEEYYCSTDTKIYIDDDEQTEIAYINYALNEQLKPLYGYSARTWDDVAVGNRIVTGVIKTPIKNIEAQSQMDTIKSRAKRKNTIVYNSAEKDASSLIEWLEPGDGNSLSGSGIDFDEYVSEAEDDETFEYKSKLIQLGYDLSYDATLSQLSNIIRSYQVANGLEATGKLNQDTMDKIDKSIETSGITSSDKKISLPYGTKIYLKPTSTSDYFTLGATQDAFILDSDYDDGWMYIMLADGTEGFVNLEIA